MEKKIYYYWMVVLGLFIFSCIMVALADMVYGECRLVSPDVARTRSEAVAQSKAYVQKYFGKEFDPQCHKGKYDEDVVWFCEESPGQCNSVIALEKYLQYGRQFEQQKRYESWPGREDYTCDNAYGCRRNRGMTP